MRRYFIIFLSTFLILIDQLSKYLIRHLDGFYVCNKGIAWGIALPSFFILTISIILLVFICLLILNYNFKNFYLIESLKLKIGNSYPVMFILSGGISNVIDRISYGCVIDFINLQFWPASIAMRSIAGWPVFNFADIFIATGAIMLILTNLKMKSKK